MTDEGERTALLKAVATNIRQYVSEALAPITERLARLEGRLDGGATSKGGDSAQVLVRLERLEERMNGKAEAEQVVRIERELEAKIAANRINARNASGVVRISRPSRPVRLS